MIKVDRQSADGLIRIFNSKGYTAVCSYKRYKEYVYLFGLVGKVTTKDFKDIIKHFKKLGIKYILIERFNNKKMFNWELLHQGTNRSFWLRCIEKYDEHRY